MWRSGIGRLRVGSARISGDGGTKKTELQGKGIPGEREEVKEPNKEEDAKGMSAQKIESRTAPAGTRGEPLTRKDEY